MKHETLNELRKEWGWSWLHMIWYIFTLHFVIWGFFTLASFATAIVSFYLLPNWTAIPCAFCAGIFWEMAHMGYKTDGWIRLPK